MHQIFFILHIFFTITLCALDANYALDESQEKVFVAVNGSEHHASILNGEGEGDGDLRSIEKSWSDKSVIDIARSKFFQKFLKMAKMPPDHWACVPANYTKTPIERLGFGEIDCVEIRNMVRTFCGIHQILTVAIHASECIQGVANKQIPPKHMESLESFHAYLLDTLPEEEAPLLCALDVLHIMVSFTNIKPVLVLERAPSVRTWLKYLKKGKMPIYMSMRYPTGLHKCTSYTKFLDGIVKRGSAIVTAEMISAPFLKDGLSHMATLADICEKIICADSFQDMSPLARHSLLPGSPYLSLAMLCYESCAVNCLTVTLARQHECEAFEADDVWFYDSPSKNPMSYSPNQVYIEFLHRVFLPCAKPIMAPLMHPPQDALYTVCQEWRVGYNPQTSTQTILLSVLENFTQYILNNISPRFAPVLSEILEIVLRGSELLNESWESVRVGLHHTFPLVICSACYTAELETEISFIFPKTSSIMEIKADIDRAIFGLEIIRDTLKDRYKKEGGYFQRFLAYNNLT